MKRDNVEVKVEVNFVLRGTVYPVQTRSLTPKARETLLADLEIPVVSLEDMYAASWSQPWIDSIRATCST